ncbi:hypothetical protein GCM10023094_56240 [Rhodococcus olei]|uniref:Uncharacterized protein n=1 Tax=Rhodococcus olei TaxID=2161675 RepID=A0ABP8PRP3_9NOCA
MPAAVSMDELRAVIAAKEHAATTTIRMPTGELEIIWHSPCLVHHYAISHPIRSPPLRGALSLDLSTWPTGIRVIAQKEQPHPGAQLRFTNHDGLRLTALDQYPAWSAPDLELRHRRRARCKDRIRMVRTGSGWRKAPG